MVSTMKKKNVRLSTKAYTAFKEIEEEKFISRSEKLLDSESGFALLLLWCQIEMMLKVIRYGDKIKYGWPSELNFIRASWAPLNRIKGINKAAYENILGTSSNSLWKYRNVIAHSGKEVEKTEAMKYWKDVIFVIDRLSEHLPTREALSAKKRRSDRQLNRKK